MVSVKAKLTLFIIASYVIFFTFPAWSAERFTVSDDCVTDNLTGLIWAKNSDNTPRTWQEALEYADEVDLCGFSDWRVPYISELDSLSSPDGAEATLPWSDSLISDLAGTYWALPDPEENGIEAIKSDESNDETPLRYIWAVRLAEDALCTYTISPSSQAVTSSSTIGIIEISPSAAGCAWEAKSNVKWLRILSGKTGTGNGGIRYSISKNKSTSQREGTMTIAGQTFTVTQEGIKQYTVTVAGTGKGSGVIKSSPSGISCGSKCSKLFNEGKAIKLTAHPSSGSTFEGWSGGSCSGTKTTCTISDIAGPVNVTAAFGSPDLAGSFETGITSTYGQNSKKYRLNGSLYITNNGDGKSSNAKVTMYLSTDGSTYSKKDMLRSKNTGDIAAGASQLVDLSILLIETDPKGKYIIAVIDPSFRIEESNENNNITVSSVIQ